MYNIISWYNQNRRKFWGIIIACVLIGLIMWRLIYNILGPNNQVPQQSQISQIDTNTLNSITVTSENSAITGRRTTINKDGITAIDNFVSYCNSGNIQEAYNLISDECKEEMYSDIIKFQEHYYKPVFGNGKRTVSTENWIGNTYKVVLNEDFLATGKYNKEKSLQDYITIVKDGEGNSKLNINSYIGRTQINKTSNSENVEIKVINKDTYMDYETYTFEVKNNSSSSIALGDVKNTEASYLLDKNNLKYNAYIHEIPQVQLVLSEKQTKNIKMKYFNQYSSTRKINSIVFPRIILDYNLYKERGQGYNNYTQINISL